LPVDALAADAVAHGGIVVVLQLAVLDGNGGLHLRSQPTFIVAILDATIARCFSLK